MVTVPADAWSAIATGTAVVVALYFGVGEASRANTQRDRADVDRVAADQDRIDAQRELREQQQQAQDRYERGQAEKVAAWLEVREVPTYAMPQTYVVVSNASDQPIWAVGMHPAHGPVDSTVPGAPDAARTWVLPPDGRYEARLIVTVFNAGQAAVPVRVTFRDNAGRFWERDRHGVLLRQPDLAAQPVRDEGA